MGKEGMLGELWGENHLESFQLEDREENGDIY
jgi:hypothetical protein